LNNKKKKNGNLPNCNQRLFLTNDRLRHNANMAMELLKEF